MLSKALTQKLNKARRHRRKWVDLTMSQAGEFIHMGVISYGVIGDQDGMTFSWGDVEYEIRPFIALNRYGDEVATWSVRAI